MDATTTLIHAARDLCSAIDKMGDEHDVYPTDELFGALGLTDAFTALEQAVWRQRMAKAA